MKHASEQPAGFWAPRPPALDAVIARRESLSLKPEFTLQREIALARALRPYLEGMAGRLVAPLAQETELVTLCLLCDFYPEDGQLTLIEQLRDVITEHIPDEERRWLDPLKHSYLDLLELTSLPKPGEDLTLRSLGDRSVFVVPGDESIRRGRQRVAQWLPGKSLARVVGPASSRAQRTNASTCGCDSDVAE